MVKQDYICVCYLIERRKKDEEDKAIIRVSSQIRGSVGREISKLRRVASSYLITM